MLLIIIPIIIIVICLYNKKRKSPYTSEPLIIFCGIWAILAIATCSIQAFDHSRTLTTYREVEIYLDINGSTMSDMDKTAYTLVSAYLNVRIKQARRWESSWWVGWFYSKEVAELDLFQRK